MLFLRIKLYIARNSKELRFLPPPLSPPPPSVATDRKPLPNSCNLFPSSLTAGFGVFGNGVSVILPSVPASETLANQINVRYNRERWSTVSGAVYLSVKTQAITVSTQVISSSLDTTSQRNAAIGEKVRIQII